MASSSQLYVSDISIDLARKAPHKLLNTLATEGQLITAKKKKRSASRSRSLTVPFFLCKIPPVYKYRTFSCYQIQPPTFATTESTGSTWLTCSGAVCVCKVSVISSVISNDNSRYYKPVAPSARYYR